MSFSLELSHLTEYICYMNLKNPESSSWFHGFMVMGIMVVVFIVVVVEIIVVLVGNFIVLVVTIIVSVLSFSSKGFFWDYEGLNWL